MPNYLFRSHAKICIARAHLSIFRNFIFDWATTRHINYVAIWNPWLLTETYLRGLVVIHAIKCPPIASGRRITFHTAYHISEILKKMSSISTAKCILHLNYVTLTMSHSYDVLYFSYDQYCIFTLSGFFYLHYASNTININCQRFRPIWCSAKQ